MQVEAEFERLYNAHIRDRGLDPQSHRACTLACLSVATYKVLYDSVSDTRLVRTMATHTHTHIHTRVTFNVSPQLCAVRLRHGDRCES